MKVSKIISKILCNPSPKTRIGGYYLGRQWDCFFFRNVVWLFGLDVDVEPLITFRVKLSDIKRAKLLEDFNSKNWKHLIDYFIKPVL